MSFAETNSQINVSLMMVTFHKYLNLDPTKDIVYTMVIIIFSKTMFEHRLILITYESKMLKLVVYTLKNIDEHELVPK